MMLQDLQKTDKRMATEKTEKKHIRNLHVPIAIYVAFVWMALTPFLVLIYVTWISPADPPEWQRHSSLPLALLARHCEDTLPIARSEFLDRQTALAGVLRMLNASAYIVEPGASAAYFGNISTSHWKLSERPLLLIITPSGESGDAQAKVNILTPKFEATRAKNLPLPSKVRYIEWPEDVNPYSLVASALAGTTGPIYVDGGIRKFIADGLEQALPNNVIATAPNEVTQLRERKSDAEIDLLKCANEVTLLSIREVHKRLYVGMHESEARTMMASALSAAGLKDGGCLTLFGENAALPHGSGSDRVLHKSDFALFDCTGSLHGYYSDITRTVALKRSKIPNKHLHIWKHVLSAQSVAFRTARAGTLGWQVDEASRSFLRAKGYASYFTHRLGHGIGLEVHEEPYLRGGSNSVIKSSHTFSNEPGIYIEGEVGVRIEDCFFINKEGRPVLLTAGVGGQSISPWAP